jgi:hypothetical protein
MILIKMTLIIECCYAECRDLFIIMLNVSMLSVIRLSVIILNVVAPFLTLGASHGKAQALPPNIRLGWRGLPGTNTLTYYENS